jgi:hypothetical protein
MSHRARILAAALVAALFVAVIGGEVVARRAEDVFGGKVIILKKRPPTTFKTADGFIQFLHANAMRVVYANADNTWTFETMAFFRRALGDWEVEMVFYDVDAGSSNAARRFVDSYTQYTQDRNTRSLSGKVQLIRPQFDANKDYMVVVQHKGDELAKGFFSTKGISQQQIDDQLRYEAELKKMEESMKDLEKKAKEQEDAAKKREENSKAADDLF